MINKVERIHSLDALRAIMMILGIVLHSTETYVVQDNEPWPKDPLATHIFLDYLGDMIHLFRMPVFFLVAGFFGALLFYQKGALGMIKNRVSRIVFPFVVFLTILSPIIVFTSSYSRAVFSGNGDALAIAVATFSRWDTFIPRFTYHLWFLYYLALITFASFLLALLFRKLPAITCKITRSFNWVMQKPIFRLFVFTSLTFLILLSIWRLSGGTPLGFKPDIKAFVYYFFFYSIGWALYDSKHLLDSIMQYDKLFSILAVVMFTLYFVLFDAIDNVIKGVISAFVLWLFILGITGLFIRYGSEHSTRMRYVSNSSYWVYLIHLPLTVVIPGLIAGWQWPALVKFSFTLSITSIICFVSYHYCVRGTFIGKFLNGRKYPTG